MQTAKSATHKGELEFLAISQTLHWLLRRDAEGSDGTALPCFWKHERHMIGKPLVGLNGTVVARPHAAHVAGHSTRRLGCSSERFALHDLHLLGSWTNCLS